MRLKPTAKNKKEDTEKAAKKHHEFAVGESLQLELFGFHQPANKRYSYTIDLYDFMPKYVWGKVERINGEFLRTLKREFEYRGDKLKIDIKPARLQTASGAEVEHFPGLREELVEDALRRLVTAGQGEILDNEVGLRFTLYQLQQELKNNNHSFSRDELKDAIRILHLTKIVLRNSTGEVEVGFSPIENYGFSGESGETQTFVRFSPLVTRSIQENTYRLANYETLMRYRSTIARQLHKRISHHYAQASLSQPYNILLSTVIRDFGLTKYKSLSDNLKQMKVALEEMITMDVVTSYKIEKNFEVSGKKKLLDAKIFLSPSLSFIQETKHRNYRHNEAKMVLSNSNNDS